MSDHRNKQRKSPDAVMLTKARLKKGYSQQHIALLSGVALRHYQRIEYGERPFSALSIRQGLLICIILDIDPFEITFGKENLPDTTVSR